MTVPATRARAKAPLSKAVVSRSRNSSRPMTVILNAKVTTAAGSMSSGWTRPAAPTASRVAEKKATARASPKAAPSRPLEPAAYQAMPSVTGAAAMVARAATRAMRTSSVIAHPPPETPRSTQDVPAAGRGTAPGVEVDGESTRHDHRRAKRPGPFSAAAALPTHRGRETTPPRPRAAGAWSAPSSSRPPAARPSAAARPAPQGPGGRYRRHHRRHHHPGRRRPERPRRGQGPQGHSGGPFVKKARMGAVPPSGPCWSAGDLRFSNGATMSPEDPWLVVDVPLDAACPAATPLDLEADPVRDARDKPIDVASGNQLNPRSEVAAGAPDRLRADGVVIPLPCVA